MSHELITYPPKDAPVEQSPLGEFVYYDKYAKYIPELSRRETWEEAWDRMERMHVSRYINVTNPTVWTLLSNAIAMGKQKKVLGSQRAMQFSGTPILDRNMRIYNCTFSFADRIGFFSDAFYLLLCGSGVGFSVQKHHVANLPAFPPALRKSLDTNRPATHIVEDSIEGWGEALRVLLASYLVSAVPVNFDFSHIRPKGSPISSGGKAPGAEPLKTALERIRGVLDASLELGDRLRPIDVYDIVMHASDAVLSGGVRRAATICLFSPDDEEMMTAKTGDWWQTNPQRARSNNSAVLVAGKTDRAVFSRIMQCAKTSGDPGFFFTPSTEFGTNPCGEILLCPVLVTNNGEAVENVTIDMLENKEKYEKRGYKFATGWQACNLSTINVATCKSEEDFYSRVIAATVLGTFQAGYSEGTSYATTRILEREALLGVSLTGIMDNPDIGLNPAILRAGAELAVQINTTLSKKLGIRPAARITCVKPEGTGSLVLGERNPVASGIHAQHHRRYIRRVQNSQLSPIYQAFSAANPSACEDSLWNTNTAEKVISFAVEAPEGAIVKSDLTAEKFLEAVKLVQENWVIPGTARPDSLEGACHNVSNTVEIAPDEWEKVEQIIWDNQHIYRGVSVLGTFGEYSIQQAPLQKVYSPEEIIAQFGAITYGLAVEALNYRKEINKEENPDLFLACEYLLMYERWSSLQASFRAADYGFVELDDNTKIADTVACAGGVCEI
jgi:ribonucleoside-diphosphate reductase alpha chain